MLVIINYILDLSQMIFQYIGNGLILVLIAYIIIDFLTGEVSNTNKRISQIVMVTLSVLLLYLRR